MRGDLGRFGVIPATDAKSWFAVLDMMSYDLRDVHFTPQWGRVYETLYPGSTAYLAVLTMPDHVVAQPFLLRQDPPDITSMGFGGPIANDPIPTRENGVAFRAAFYDWQDKNNVLSTFTLYNPLFEAEQFYLAAVSVGDGRREKDVVILPTAVPLDPSHGRWSDAKVAEKAGVRATWEIGGDLTAFALDYSARMVELDAPQRWRLPNSYFMAIMEHLRDRSGVAYYATATATDASGNPLTRALFLLSPTAFYYHLSVGASKHRGANDTLIWQAHAVAKAQGAPWLFLGGGAQPDDGVFRYKRSFGGVVVPTYSKRIIHNHSAYHDACNRSGVNLLKAMGDGFFPAYRKGEA